MEEKIKGRWYAGNLVKGILIAIAHVLAVILIISMIWVLAYPVESLQVLDGKTTPVYEDSEMFGDQVFSDATSVLFLTQQDMLFSNGKLQGDKLVDIEEYYDLGTVSGENKNGLAYTLEDLANWGEAYLIGEAKLGESYENLDSSNPVIVCKRPDGTYRYLYYEEFKSEIDSGGYQFIVETEDYTSGAILEELRDGSWRWSDGASNGNFAVAARDGTIVYVNCWNYDGYWIEEEYAPQGAESILQLANENPAWNGRLSEACNMVANTVIRIADTVSQYEAYSDTWQEGNTNLQYLYVNRETREIYTNCDDYKDYERLDQSIAALKSRGKYVQVMPKLADFETNIDTVTSNLWVGEVKGYTAENFVFLVSVDTAYPIQDAYYDAKTAYDQYIPKAKLMWGLMVSGAVLLLAVIVWLTLIAGRRREDRELHLLWIDRQKTEVGILVILAVWGGVWALFTVCMDAFYVGYESVSGELYYYSGYYSGVVMWGTAGMLPAAAAGIVSCSLFLIGYLSLVRRIKAGNFWKNSIARWGAEKLIYVIHQIPVIWKQLLIFAVFLFSQWLVWASDGEFVFYLMGAAVSIGVLAYLIRDAVGKSKIQEGLKRIAAGEVDYKINMEHLSASQREVAERINTIGQGLDAAVEASVKSERLKTDLITNVSHDIKTPLTSIINYIDLLKREKLGDPKIEGYLDILEAKAQRLKILTEDVVEASKVSSGNVTLELMNLDLVEMVQQTSGEFAEKFEKRGLQEILKLPEEPALILADGRKMWRILENIYNNVAKYALEGTRVYGDLKVVESKVIFSLKNISEQPLNICADELTERFIRGDVSRSTEGSGLGLSIAKNLAKLMGGTFEIYLDGDLFRVTIMFPESKPVRQLPV